VALDLPETYEKGHLLHNRFEITNLLKSSGMSRVYLGFDKQRLKRVIIKCPSYSDTYSSQDAIKLERLMVESQVLRALKHPSVISYVDSWDDGGDYHLVTDYVNAQSMKDAYEGHPPNINDIIEYMLQLLEVTEYLHYKGIIHRDIKPANILLSDNIILLDFGASEANFLNISHRKVTMGTPGYQCPESFRGALSQQCDIYSIGATLLFLLTGEKPSGDLSRFRNLTSHSELLAIALKAMNPYPVNRFRTAFEMKRSLERLSPTSIPRITIGNNNYALTKNRMLIGRGDDTDIKIDDPLRYVSPLQAEICRDNGQFFLIDKSVNGTYVYRNEEYRKIDKWCLADGDIIVLCYNPSKGPYKILKFRNTCL
jgi:serine/threonine protein kinase